jgi:hypothetical protein
LEDTSPARLGGAVLAGEDAAERDVGGVAEGEGYRDIERQPFRVVAPTRRGGCLSLLAVQFTDNARNGQGGRLSRKRLEFLKLARFRFLFRRRMPATEY